jgi:biopolymer transport protein ExbD
LNINLNKIILITLVLLTIFTISAVSASDDISDDANLTVAED